MDITLLSLTSGFDSTIMAAFALVARLPFVEYIEISTRLLATDMMIRIHDMLITWASEHKVLYLSSFFDGGLS